MDYGETHALSKLVWDLIQKFEEIGCTCNRPSSERPVPVETVAEVHQTISIVSPVSTRSISSVLHLPNSTVHKILHALF